MMSEDPKTNPRPSSTSRMANAILNALNEAHNAHEVALRIDAGRDSAYVGELAEAIRLLEQARKNAIDTLEG